MPTIKERRGVFELLSSVVWPYQVNLEKTSQVIGRSPLIWRASSNPVILNWRAAGYTQFLLLCHKYVLAKQPGCDITPPEILGRPDVAHSCGTRNIHVVGGLAQVDSIEWLMCTWSGKGKGRLAPLYAYEELVVSWVKGRFFSLSIPFRYMSRFS